jgi:excisionase family DNA binding protein
MLKDIKQPPELMTVKELAAEWRQHPMTIYRKIQAGEIHAIRLGDDRSALRIPRASLPQMAAETAERRGEPVAPAVEPRPLAGPREAA